MKLKTYNSENLPVSSKSKPTMYINQKSGVFHFNANACERLKLKAGESIEFHQDEENNKDWFISKSNSGFAVRNKDKSSDSMGVTFNNTTLAKLLFEKLEYNEQSGTVLIGSEAVKIGKIEYYPIITSYLFRTK